MRLTRSDLRLMQQGLDHVIHDAEIELERNSNNEAICRWANETIKRSQELTEQLEVIYDTLTSLYNRDVEADVLLSPSLSSDP